MPFYEYRPKSGSCEICHGRFVDLQKMSDPTYKNCPDCGQECERVISAPMVSIKGAEFKAAANAEKRRDSFARASGAIAKERSENVARSTSGGASSSSKRESLPGHQHDCEAHGCFARAEALLDGKSEGSNEETSGPGGMPYLIGSRKASTKE